MSLSKAELTREMLEEIGVVSVDEEKIVARDLGRIQGVHKDCDNIVYRPSLAKQKDKKGVLRYLSTTISIYNPLTKMYNSFSLHKLLYTWNYGFVPEGVEIDHINTNPLDNRVENLRPVNRTINAKNRRKWKMFTEEEIQGKSIKEVKEMIDKRIKEYDDNPYYEQIKEIKKAKRDKFKEDTKGLRNDMQQKRTKITWLEKQIRKIEVDIEDLYESRHSPEYIIKKADQLRKVIELKKCEIKKLSEEIDLLEKEYEISAKNFKINC